MKHIFEAIIKAGSYDLTALLKKIDTYHIEGKITDTERDELYALARGDAKPVYDVEREIEKLWEAVRELKAGTGAEHPVEPEAVPEFVQPTGAHDAYHVGDRVLFGGAVYVCAMDNCVWSPDVLPSAWSVM